MTPRERAKEATQSAGMPQWGSDDQEQLELAVEQAINAAVEEERECLTQAALAACENAVDAAIAQENEACAQIVHGVYLAWFDGDWSPGEAFESAKEKIRFRLRCNTSATENNTTESKIG